MALIITEQSARDALDRAGALQRSISDEEGNPEAAAVELADIMDSVITWLLRTGHDETSVYTSLISPYAEWGMYGLGPKFVAVDGPEGDRWRRVFETVMQPFNKYKHLAPER